MRRFNKIKTVAVLLSGVVIAMTMVCLPAGQAYAEVKKIVRDTDISSDYLPGSGTPIGKIRDVHGKVLIMHEDMSAVYIAQKGFALYAGDTLTTRETGRIVFVLKDDSVLTLAPGTTMVLNEAVLDPVNKKRSALVNLVTGKARFFVKKFSDFQHSTFNVRTKTSIAAVRGSDFIIEQIGDKTIITALGMTVLEVTNLDNPLAAPIEVNSFQQLILTLGQLPGNPFGVTQEELTAILESLGIPLDGDDGDGGDGGDGGDDDDDDDDDDWGQDDGTWIDEGPSYNDQPVSPSSP